MALIRIGFIGLSASGSWAATAHLPYLSQTSKYQITALLNSSVASAEAAIKAHSLPQTTKAYGTPADLAADPDIDLVVCSVRVDRHFPILRPLLQTSKSIKAIYCEWPLAANLAEAEELAALAKSRGIRTLVGLQGRQSPILSKIKGLLDSGRICDVLSVSVVAAAHNFGAEDLAELAYLQDEKTGGNMVTIHFSHYFDLLTQALGQPTSFSSILATKRPTTALRDKPLSHKSTPSDPVTILGTIPRTTPDHLLLQGVLSPSNALLSFHLRGGPELPGTPASVWSIYGTAGEIRVSGSAFPSIGGPTTEIRVHDHASGEVEQLGDAAEKGDEWDEKGLPWPARNVARLYEVFAEGAEREGDEEGRRRGEHEYADWDEAVVRHRLVDELFWRERKGNRGLLPAQYVSDTYGESLEL